MFINHACNNRRKGAYRLGSSCPSTKTCHPQSSRIQQSRSRLVHKLPIYSSQKRGRSQTSSQSQRFKPFCGVSTFQNGRCFNVERFVKTQRFFNKNRSKRCLPYCSGMNPLPHVSPLSLAGHDVGVRMPPLWSRQCPSNVHQVAQTSGGPVGKDGDKAKSFT